MCTTTNPTAARVATVSAKIDDALEALQRKMPVREFTSRHDDRKIKGRDASALTSAERTAYNNLRTMQQSVGRLENTVERTGGKLGTLSMMVLRGLEREVSDLVG